MNSESGMHPIDPPLGAEVVSSESALAKAAKLAPLSSWLRKDNAVALLATSMTETHARDISFLWAATKVPNAAGLSEVPARWAASASSSTWNRISWAR